MAEASTDLEGIKMCVSEPLKSVHDDHKSLNFLVLGGDTNNIVCEMEYVSLLIFAVSF